MISELKGWPTSDKLSDPGQKSDVILHLRKHLLHVGEPQLLVPRTLKRLEGVQLARGDLV